jgi:hypothetical protein
MPTIMRGPPNRISSPAVRGSRRDVRPTSGRGFLRTSHGTTSIILHKTVEQLAATRNIERAVLNTMDPKLGNRVVVAVAAGELVTSDHSDTAELLRARASDGVRHGATV